MIKWLRIFFQDVDWLWDILDDADVGAWVWRKTKRGVRAVKRRRSTRKELL